MDSIEYKEKKKSASIQSKEVNKSSVQMDKGSEFINEDVSKKRSVSKQKAPLDSSLMDLNESVLQLDLAMISDEINWKETISDPQEKKLSDKDFLLEEAFRMKAFLESLDKTGSVEDNETLSSIKMLLEFNTTKWLNGIEGVHQDEKGEQEKIQDYMSNYHDVSLRLLDLAQKYLETDKYWMTRSGYRRKDLCQKIVKWATREDRVAARWEARMVSRKVNEGASKEFAKRNGEHFAIIKDRLNNEPGDESLTKDARRNIHEIDTWILRHTDLGAGDDGMEELQASLMRLSTRERLYVYYLIETGKRKKPEDLDLALSQFNYVPSPEKFKSVMVSKKIWKGFSTDSRILWSKLSDAMLQVKNLEAIKNLGTWEEANVAARRRVADSLGEEENDQEIEEKYKLRNSRLGDAIKSLQTYKASMEKLEEKRRAGKNTDKQQKEVDKLYNQLSKSLNLLDEADRDMPSLGEIEKSRPDLAHKESIEREQAAGDGLGLINIGAGGATAVDKAVMVKDYVQWGFVDEMIKAIPMLKAGTGALSALAGFTAMMVDISLMIKLSGEINGPAIVDRLANLGYVTSLTTTYGVNAAATTASAIKGVPVTELTNAVTKQLAILAGVSAGIYAGINIAEHIGISKRVAKIDRAEKALEKRQQDKSSEDDKNIRLENAILKMEKRMEKTKRKVAWINTSAAVLTAVAAIPVAGLGAAVAGLGVTMAASFAVSSKGRKKLAKEVVDAYIEDKFNQEYTLRYGEYPENYKELDKKQKALVDKRSKAVENYICAGLGYSDREKFLSGIQQEMALYLHKKLFTNEETGEELYREDLENKDIAESVQPYMDMAYGLGLKVKLPHRPKEGKGGGGHGKPSVRKIFLKMKF